MFEKSKKKKNISSNRHTSLEPKSRFNITMAPSIKHKVDIAAKNMGISSSAFITMCVSNYFMQQDSLKSVDELKRILNSLQNQTKS